MKWLIILIVSQFFDVFSTGFVLYRGGIETNNIALAIIHSGGVLALLLVKIAYIVLAALIVYRATRYGSKHIRLTNIVVGGMAVVFLLGSCWNIFVGMLV